MANAQAFPATCEEVLDVESKWPYLPITPTYDQYVQRWVVMPEREGFHLKTRSVMKQLLEDAKCKVLFTQVDTSRRNPRQGVTDHFLMSRRTRCTEEVDIDTSVR
jgi:hypothetical protein